MPAAPARLAVGDSLFAQGRFDEAIVAYGKVIEADPRSAAGHIGRARAFGQKGEYRRAIADCTTAIGLDAGAVGAFNCRGLAFVESGDIARGLADLTVAIRLGPSDARPRVNRARLSARRRLAHA